MDVVQRIMNLFRGGMLKRDHKQQMATHQERTGKSKLSRAERRRLWKAAWSAYNQQ